MVSWPPELKKMHVTADVKQRNVSQMTKKGVGCHLIAALGLGEVKVRPAYPLGQQDLRVPRAQGCFKGGL